MLFFTIILVVCFVSVSNKKNNDTIKIGFVGPLTGDMANWGENTLAAVLIAVDEINQAGGILGKKIEIIPEDDICTGRNGADAVSKLINIDKVVAIAGGVCSGATLGEAPISEAAKIPQVSFCPTNPTISQAGDYIFRVVPSDIFQSRYAAKYLSEIGKKNIAVLSIKNDWGNGLNKAFISAFTKNYGSVIFNDSFDQDTKDMRAQLSKIKAKNPDAVYFIGYTDQTIAGLKQAHDLGIKTTFFGADPWDDAKIWNELGSLGDGAMYTVIGTNSSDAFKAKMKAKLGKNDFIYCSNYAYDTLKILTSAINMANSTEGTAIKKALYETNYTNGVSMKEIKFDANGDPTSALFTVKIIKDGKAKEVTK